MTHRTTRMFLDGRQRNKHAETIYGIFRCLNDLSDVISVANRVLDSNSPHFDHNDRLEAQQAKRAAMLKTADLLRDLEAFQDEVAI